MIKHDLTFISVDMYVSARVQINFGRVTFETHPGCSELNHSICIKYITIYIYKTPNTLDNDIPENIKQWKAVKEGLQAHVICYLPVSKTISNSFY